MKVPLSSGEGRSVIGSVGMKARRSLHCITSAETFAPSQIGASKFQEINVLILLASVVKTGNHYIDHNLISIEI